MSHSRRRIIRTARQAERNGTQSPRHIEKLRARLDEKQKVLSRYLVRLKRVFHAFEKMQNAIARLERQISKLEKED